MGLTQEEIDLCLQCAKMGIKVEDVYAIIDELLQLCEPIKELFEENVEFLKNKKKERIESDGKR